MIDEIKKRISSKMNVDQIEIIDQSHQHAGHTQNTYGGHYKAIIISDDFNNKNLVERHRMIYDALGDLMQNEIHAFSMNTLTVSEFNNK